MNHNGTRKYFLETSGSLKGTELGD